MHPPHLLEVYLQELERNRNREYSVPKCAYRLAIPETAADPESAAATSQLAQLLAELRAIESTSLFRLRHRLNVVLGRSKATPATPEREVSSGPGEEPFQVPSGLEAAVLRERIRGLEQALRFRIVVSSSERESEKLLTSLDSQWFKNFWLDWPSKQFVGEEIEINAPDVDAGPAEEVTLFAKGNACLSPLALYYFADACKRSPDSDFFYGDSVIPSFLTAGLRPDYDPLLASQWEYKGQTWLSRRGTNPPFHEWSDGRVFHIPFPIEREDRVSVASKPEYGQAFQGLLSVIVPTKNQPRLLKGLIESVRKHEPQPYEIVVVDNGSTDATMLQYLDSVDGSEGVQIVRAPIPFIYSRLNNIGAFHARGDILAFVNDDVELRANGTLRSLASLASAQATGAVGPMLLYENGTIQHGGIAMGYNGVTYGENSFVGRNPDDKSLDPRANLLRRVSAVTGACLLVEREKFLQVGGFDEALPVTCNDADFCLKLFCAGYHNLYAGHLNMTHYSHQSRGPMDNAEKVAKFWSEAAVIINRFGIDFVDPYYNPSLGFNASSGLPTRSRIQSPWRG